MLEQDICEWERKAKESCEGAGQAKRREIERLFREEFGDAELEETSRYQQEGVVAAKGLEKTTPRSSRPSQRGIPTDSERKKKGVGVPRLPISRMQSNHKVTPPLKKAQSYTRFDNSQSNRGRSSEKRPIEISHEQEKSNSINESQIVPPPCMLNDQFGEWDSMLDDTKVNVRLLINHYLHRLTKST